MSYQTNTVVVDAERHTTDPDPTNLDAIAVLMGELDRIDLSSGILAVDHTIVNPGYWIVLRQDTRALYAVVSDDDFQANYTEIP